MNHGQIAVSMTTDGDISRHFQQECTLQQDSRMHITPPTTPTVHGPTSIDEQWHNLGLLEIAVAQRVAESLNLSWRRQSPVSSDEFTREERLQRLITDVQNSNPIVYGTPEELPPQRNAAFLLSDSETIPQVRLIGSPVRSPVKRSKKNQKKRRRHEVLSPLPQHAEAHVQPMVDMRSVETSTSTISDPESLARTLPTAVERGLAQRRLLKTYAKSRLGKALRLYAATTYDATQQLVAQMQNFHTATKMFTHSECIPPTATTLTVDDPVVWRVKTPIRYIQNTHTELFPNASFTRFMVATMYS